MNSEHLFDLLFNLINHLKNLLTGAEVLFCNLRGENSDFVRINHQKIRQAGHVHTANCGLLLFTQERAMRGSFDLTGEFTQDFAQARQLLIQLRERLDQLPPDPYLQYATTPSESWSQHDIQNHQASEILAEILDIINYKNSEDANLDLVGIWASGEISSGLVSSLGHRHWQQTFNTQFDWSIYLTAQQAVKGSMAATQWDNELFRSKIIKMREELEILARPPRNLAPGRYRAYLTPTALSELLGLVAGESFALRAVRTNRTALRKLVRGEIALDSRVTMMEESTAGLSTKFTAEGFLKPDKINLIKSGICDKFLVDARSGKEYGMPVNASGGAVEALVMMPGQLSSEKILNQLDTGILIGNLWYCNWSDPNECRLTGATRFGTYWVEHGVIQEPIAVMRFDDSLYNLLGKSLIDLTCEREFLLSNQTYGGRSTESMYLPGLLVAEFNFTL